MSRNGPTDNSVVQMPLLNRESVLQLLNAAPSTDIAARRQPPQQGRPGEQTALATGGGMDFADLIPYQPGHDPRFIDWRATARASHPLVRTFHADLGRPVYLLVDRRSGMRFGTRERLKITQAVRVALWLGGREARAGHEVGSVLLDNPCQWVPHRRGLTAMIEFSQLAAAPAPPMDSPADESGWQGVLSGLRQRLPRGSALILVSDFLDLKSADIPLLRMLARHCELELIRIVDPAEVKLPQVSNLSLIWAGRRVQLRQTDAERTALQDKMEQVADFIVAACSENGIRYQQVGTEVEDLSEVLL